MASTKTSSLRILILAPGSSLSNRPIPTPSAFPAFLKRLTGTEPSQDLVSFAGYTSHAPLHLQTKYYESNVSIWCDELPDPTTTIPPKQQQPQAESKAPQSLLDAVGQSEWQDQMTSEAAREVRDVIGAIILLLPHDNQSTLNSSATSSTISSWTSCIETVSSLRDLIEDESAREVASLVVLQDFNAANTNIDTDTKSGSKNPSINTGQTLLEKLEEECLSGRGILGWDFITINNHDNETTIEETSRNEFGEKTGFPRVIEVLEGVDWSTDISHQVDDHDDDHNTSFNTKEMDMSFLDDINLSSTITTQQQQQQGSKPNAVKYHQLSQSPGLTSHDIIQQHDDEFEREIMEMKLAMLGIEDNSSDNDDEQDSSDDFGALASAELPKKTSRSDNDDVWAALDHKDDESMQVDQLQGLMERVVAIREAGSEMSPADREKFAKREISRLMKQL